MKIDTYWHLIDQIAAAVCILDNLGVIRHANQDVLDLLGMDSLENLLGNDFKAYISSPQQTKFAVSHQSLLADQKQLEQEFTLIRNDGSPCQSILSGTGIKDETGAVTQTVWTLKEVKSLQENPEDAEQQRKLEDMQWLSEQGRTLLTINHWPDILDHAGQALQEKLGDCIVLTLTTIDELALRIEGIYGLDDTILSELWKVTGGSYLGRIFPIDQRYKDTYSRRKLYLHTDSIEEFTISQIPQAVVRKMVKIVGLENVYTIGLEGNQQVMGCFYILTLVPDKEISTDLVESFTFQVALALEKTKYAEDLEISEQQFQTIFEYAPDGYYLSDLQGKFLDGNIAAEKIVGYDRGELLGKSFLDAGLLSKKQIPRAAKLLAQNLIGKSTGPDIFELIRKDGSLVQVEITTYPVKMGGKSVVLGIARDITKRKKIEENLEKAHETLTRVLEGIDAHVYVSDIDTYEILYMNKKMIEDFGGDFTGRQCYEVFRSGKEHCPDCTNHQLVDNQGNPGEVLSWEGKNQKTNRWYRNYDRAICWTDQRIVRMQIAVDITDSKQASKALELSEERYRSLFESSQNAIMTVSPPTWKFTSGNPALIELFRLKDEQEFLKYTPWELSPDIQPDGSKSEEKALEMIQTAVENGFHFFNWTHKRVDGEEFPATVQLTRVDLGDDYFIQATVRDITTQVQAEEQLMQQMDDLALMNTLNIAANQGQSLKEINAILAQETKRIFNCNNTTVYLLDSDHSHLQVDIQSLESALRKELEKLIGTDIPDRLEMSLDKESIFRDIIKSGEAQILTDRHVIQGLMKEFLASTFLPEVLKKGIAKLIPQIQKISGVKSIVIAPLITTGGLSGLVDMSLPYLFHEDQKERFKNIIEQMSGIIQRIQIEEEREKNIREIELIYETVVEGSRIEDFNEICQLLAEKVYSVNPDSYVLVSLFDPNRDAIRVRGLKGLGDKADRLINLVGKRPEDILINVSENPLDDSLHTLYTSGKLERTPGGLYDLTRGTIPKRICKSAEKMLGVSEVYMAGFGLDSKSTGGLIIAVKEGKRILYPAAIETIVNYFAVLFERRTAQKDVLMRKAQLEALREVELEITSQLNLDDLLFSIADKARMIVNANACGFSIYNPDKSILEFISYTGFDKLPDDTDLKAGEGLSGRVWEQKETIIVPNYTEWEGRSENWAPVGNFYLAGIPVSWGNEMLGVLEVALNLNEELSNSELELLELFAAQAAVAIKNAQLFHEEKLRRREAVTLREVGLLINRMMDRPELLDMILTALQKVVPYSTASIQLVDGNDLVVEAFRGTDHPERIIGTAYDIKTNKVSHPVLFEGKKVILHKSRDDQDWLEGPEIEKIQSWLAVPLEVKGNCIGLLSVDHYQPNQYTERDADLAVDFANQAAIALENNRLFEEIRRRTKEIEAVYQSAITLTQDLHPEVLLDHLYEQVEDLFNPDAFILATYEPNSEIIRVSYAVEAGKRQINLEGLEISQHEKNSLLSWIVRKKTPLLIGNVETDSLPVQPQQTGKTLRSWLGIPLLVSERLVGALVIQSYEAQAYNHDQRRLLQLLGNQAAVAVENSRLFEDAQRRLSRITSLREIDQTISGNIDLEMTMEVLVGQLIQTLEVDAACVLVFNKNQQTLDYLSTSGFRTESLRYTSLKIGEGLAGTAAKERTLIHIPDLNTQETSLQKSPLVGKEDFISYIAQPLIAKEEIVGVLEIFHRKPLEPNPEWLIYLDALARLSAIAIDRLNVYNDLAKSNIELQQAYDATIEGWARAIELRDSDTEVHSRRVVSLTLNLARKMGVDEESLTHIRRGALLHDIGKMAIPDQILAKTGPLSEEEWVMMKKHPVFALDMLSEIEYLEPALDIPYCHHERWDGSGYPQGLSGNKIPLAARIFAVVDVWDALQDYRPYRDAWAEKEAIAYLKEQSGKEFDPEVVEAFFDLIGKS